MGDSSCLLHGFSYASAVPNDSKQGNQMHALGESISFGRFTITAESECVSWDRWSTLSHNKYVEEAERYAQPGSVAQKKAFFEAHYKRIAAQRAAAAAAAALLHQQLQIQIAENQLETIHDIDTITITKEDVRESISIRNANGEPQAETHTQVSSMRSNAAANHVHVRERISNGERENQVSHSTMNTTSSCSSVKRVKNLEKNNAASVSVSETSETSSSQIEKPLLKHNSVDSEEVSSVMRKTRGGLSSMKTPCRRTPSTPAKALLTHPRLTVSVNHSTRKSNVEAALDGKSSSLRALLSLGSYREPEIDSIVKSKRAESAHTSSTPPKDCPTPFKTPAPAEAEAANKNKSVSSYTAATPQSHNTRTQTPDPSGSASGRRTSAPKWHLLSAVCSKSLSAYRNKLQSPTVSTPFMLRTEERAAKRKQKLEEKFNATEVQKTQQKTLKEKAGNEFRKLSCSLCFKARPLPDFYKQREPTNNHTKKPPVAQPQTAVLGRSVSNKKHGTISMPPPPPPPRSLAKTTSVTKNYSKKKIVNQSKLFLSTSLPGPDERMAHENASPNIQH